MLKITVPAFEAFDASNGLFLNVREQTLQLEHSLVSLSKWESEWKKPFFSEKAKTTAELDDYIRCMTITQNVDPRTYRGITREIRKLVLDYIEMPMTATTFSHETHPNRGEIVTAEIIYYWMIVNGIPFECQKWHLSRLLTLIRVCGLKKQAPQKIPRSEALASRRALNAARRKKWNTRG